MFNFPRGIFWIHFSLCLNSFTNIWEEFGRESCWVFDILSCLIKFTMLIGMELQLCWEFFKTFENIVGSKSLVKWKKEFNLFFVWLSVSIHSFPNTGTPGKFWKMDFFIEKEIQRLNSDTRQNIVSSKKNNVKLGVPKAHMWHFFFDIFVDDRCNKIKFSSQLFFADDLKLFINMKYTTLNCKKKWKDCVWCVNAVVWN